MHSVSKEKKICLIAIPIAEVINAQAMHTQKTLQLVAIPYKNLHLFASTSSSPNAQSNCTGECPLTFCRACYNLQAPASTPPGDCAAECDDYDPRGRCFRRWVTCVRRAHDAENGRVSGGTICYYMYNIITV